MKFRIVLLLLVIIACVFSIAAQKREFEIEVFMNETGISKDSKEIPVKVTITNTGSDVLRTGGLNLVNFYFSKCILGAVCNETGDIFTSSIRIPGKRLKENDSFEFNVNIADLYWKDAKIDPNYSENVKNFGTVPESNIFFYAAIKLLMGYKMKNHGPRYKNGKVDRVVVSKRPVYKTVNSNVIGITFD